MPSKSNLDDVLKLISDIKRQKLPSFYNTAIKTEQLLESLISNGEWNTAQELMNLITERIVQVNKALPHEAPVTNIMRHILKIIREEYLEDSENKGEGESLHQLVTADTDKALDYSKPVQKLKSSLLAHLAEYKVELESSGDNVAAQASEHIHSNEIILTLRKSKIVENFLKTAAKTRKFHVIVVETAPSYYGHLMAASLGKSNIQTTLIPDSAIFAIMSRVNKVIIGTHTVMANGGLRAISGAHSVALAAKHYSVPVMVLTHMYKLSPIYVSAYEHDAFNVCASPAAVLPYSSGPIINKVNVYNPVFDYVPPELITLFITHQGGNAPSYIYRLLSELYHPEDYEM